MFPQKQIKSSFFFFGADPGEGLFCYQWALNYPVTRRSRSEKLGSGPFLRDTDDNLEQGLGPQFGPN